MDSDLAAALADLRDIHPPLPPGLWPPAYGWWLAAALSLIALGVGIWMGRRRFLQMRAYRLVRREAETLTRERNDLMLGPRDYADRINALYKRLLVHVEGRRDAVPLHGDAWLQCLGERFRHGAFTEGPGDSLGTARFAPRSVDDSELPDLVKATLAKSSPPPRRLTKAKANG